MDTNDLEVIKGFIPKLVNHELLGDDQEQAAIDRIGDAGDKAALPVLRKALRACEGYVKWAETLPKDRPGLWIYEVLSIKMKSRLEKAIEKCTPSGKAAARKWWQFWG